MPSPLTRVPESATSRTALDATAQTQTGFQDLRYVVICQVRQKNLILMLSNKTYKLSKIPL